MRARFEYMQRKPQEAKARGKLQLLDVLLGVHGRVPPGFLHSIAERCSTDAEIDDVIAPTLDVLPSLVHGMSPLADFHGPLTVLATLSEHPSFAAAMTRHPKWQPAVKVLHHRRTM